MKTKIVPASELDASDMRAEKYVDDPTELARRILQPAANALKDDEIPGPTWDTQRLQEDFDVLGFAAPFVVVRRKSDGVKGSLCFRHHPRVYFGFEPERKP